MKAMLYKEPFVQIIFHNISPSYLIIFHHHILSVSPSPFIIFHHHISSPFITFHHLLSYFIIFYHHISWILNQTRCLFFQKKTPNSRTHSPPDDLWSLPLCRGLEVRCSDPVLNAQLYSNRAHVRLLLRQFVEAAPGMRSWGFQVFWNEKIIGNHGVFHESSL